MPQRKLKGLSGSQNEQDELVLILSKHKPDAYQQMVNRYGSNSHAMEVWLANRSKEEKQDLSELETKVKEESKHNDEFQAQVKKEYEQQHSRDKINREESGYQTV